MDNIKNSLSGIPRLHKAVLPTPVHELPALTEISGCRVFVKRDDLTGFGFGGNKARKLDFLIAEALDAGCDTVIAVGANQSNFCRMATAYGISTGMEVHLVLGGVQPAKPTGNLLLDHILGARIHHTDSGNWKEWEEYACRLEKYLSGKGRKVYRLAVGGSTVTGALGYVEAMGEIIRDEERLGLSFKAVMFATSSSGTQAGLVAGKAISGWPGKIYGFSAAKNKTEQEEDVFRLATDTAARLATTVIRKDIIADDSQLGKGYGKPTKACLEAVDFFARKCGIFLDHVYTGKAAAGLMECLRSKRYGPSDSLLFILTGGNPELFA